jgi:hypothetical protein
LLSGFHVVQSPQISGQLLAAGAIADNDIWAVGFSDQVLAPPVVDSTLAEHFDGKSWSIVSTPPTPSGGVNPPNAQLRGVAGAAGNDVWAVGFKTGPDNPDFGEQLIEHWNGTSWSIDTTGPMMEGGGLDAVTVVSSKNAWAVGSEFEHWNGTSWSIVSNPVISGGASAISADSANDIWAVQGETILHFDGTNWTLVTSHPNVNATSVTALSPTNVWVAGTVSVFFNHRQHSQAAIEHWDGTSWSIVPSPPPTKSPGLDSFLDGIAAVSANDISAVGSFDTNPGLATLTEHWDGASWKIIGSPNPGTATDGLLGVTALSDGTATAVGFQRDQGFDATPLIMQNSASAPKTATTMSAPVNAASVLPAGIIGPAQMRTTPAPPDATPVDQFFTTARKAKEALSLIGRGLAAHPTATDDGLDGLLDDIWLQDRP